MSALKRSPEATETAGDAGAAAPPPPEKKARAEDICPDCELDVRVVKFCNKNGKPHGEWAKPKVVAVKTGPLSENAAAMERTMKSIAAKLSVRDAGTVTKANDPFLTHDQFVTFYRLLKLHENMQHVKVGATVKMGDAQGVIESTNNNKVTRSFVVKINKDRVTVKPWETAVEWEVVPSDDDEESEEETETDTETDSEEEEKEV